MPQIDRKVTGLNQDVTHALQAIGNRPATVAEAKAVRQAILLDGEIDDAEADLIAEMSQKDRSQIEVGSAAGSISVVPFVDDALGQLSISRLALYRRKAEIVVDNGIAKGKQLIEQGKHLVHEAEAEIKEVASEAGSAFQHLYQEGKEGRPKMMTVGLHCRLAGRPGRVGAVQRFIEHVRAHEGVWLARRIDIARHWHENHPYRAPALRPSRMEFEAFVQRFGGVFEHSPWVAERAYELELGPAHDTAGGLHNALCRAFRSASESERLGVLMAHPDLAGRLAAAKRLTPDSAREQASAGLDALTDTERELFSKLNAAYVTTFGFPFIIAVKGKTKDEILAAFEQRIGNSRAEEFKTACGQVERIALLRLKDILPQ